MPASAPPRVPLELPLDLPPDLDVEFARGCLIGRRRAEISALEGAGFRGREEPRTRASGLAGRAPVPELDTAGQFLLRRYRHGGLLRWLTGDRFADRDRPLRELVLADELHARGLLTPRAVAFRARRAFPFGWRLELVSERVAGARDLESVLSGWVERAGPSARRRALARAVGAALGEAHRHGFAHADLQPKNMLVEEPPDGAPRVWWIDLDRCAIVPRLTSHERRANLARLARGIEKRGGLGLSAADVARALCAYEPDRAARRAHCAAVRAQLRREGWRHRLAWWLERLVGGARLARQPIDARAPRVARVEREQQREGRA